MNDSRVTEILANHVSNAMEIQLDDLLINQVKKVYLDYLCSAITGSDTDVGKLVYKSLLEVEGEGNCNIIAQDKGLSKTNAAFVNGTFSHCLDLDDGHTKGSIHPGTVVLPALLAAAQQVRPDFEELAKATIIGYEVCLRISSAIHPSSRKRGFHNTPVAGIFGAVAAICTLKRFSKEEVQNAFGIAASFAGGLFAFLGTGSEVKRIHPGQAARDAVLAVELTEKGLSGPKFVLESENGFFQAFAGGNINEDRLFRELGETFEIMNIYFKPYPCCRHLHSSIDAVYKIRETNQFELQEIASIRVGVNSIAYKHRHYECQTFLDAQMSLPYAVSSAFVHPILEISHFYPDRCSDSVKSLIPLVEVYVDERAEKVYPLERPAIVEITLKSGEKIIEYIHNPKGEPSIPLSGEILEHKFKSNCSPIIGEDKALRILDSVNKMENLNFLYEI